MNEVQLGMEPALCQYRMRPTWRDLGEGWTEWKDCAPEAAADYERTPVLNDWKNEVRRLYTAAQVQAMGRVPPATKVSRGHAFRPHAEYPWFCADCGYALRDELMHPAAPRPPVAQERGPLTDEQIHKWWASENGLEDCDMCKLVDFTAVVRAVEAKRGVKPAP